MPAPYQLKCSVTRRSIPVKTAAMYCFFSQAAGVFIILTEWPFDHLPRILSHSVFVRLIVSPLRRDTDSYWHPFDRWDFLSRGKTFKGIKARVFQYVWGAPIRRDKYTCCVFQLSVMDRPVCVRRTPRNTGSRLAHQYSLIFIVCRRISASQFL